MMSTLSEFVCCADLGGSGIKVGLLVDNRFVGQDKIVLENDAKWLEVLASIENSWRTLAAQQKVKFNPAMVGLALPCVVDPSAKRPTVALDKYAGSTDWNSDDWANERFGCNAILENDANAAMAGEWIAGAGSGCDNLALLNLGTGIGTSAIINGIPLRGANGAAGCLSGHLTVEVNGQLCKCRNIGCAEAEASGWALPELAKRHPEFDDSFLKDEIPLTAKSISKFAADDHLASILWSRAIEVWGAAAVNLIHAYDPQKLIVSGGISKAGSDLLVGLRDYVQRHRWRGLPQVDIVMGELGDRAALIGLAHLADCSRR